MPHTDSDISLPEDNQGQTRVNAEQARQALRRLLDTQNPDPLDVVALDRIINPGKYERDMFGIPGFGFGGGFFRTEWRVVNNSSEEGVLHQRSFTIWLDKLNSNQEYQQIEAQLDEMRQAAHEDPNYRLSDDPKFQELYQRRMDIQDGLEIIAQRQAEQELGITDATAKREIGSGEHILKKHPELDFGMSDDLVGRAYIASALAASTTTNKDQQTLSADATRQLTEARQGLQNALDNLDRLKADPSTNSATLNAAKTQMSFAYSNLSDLQHQNNVFPDYSNTFDAERKQRELDAQKPEQAGGGRATPATVSDTQASAFDGLDKGAVAAQGDQGMIAELAALGAVPAGLANDPASLSGGAKIDRDATLQTPRM